MEDISPSAVEKQEWLDLRGELGDVLDSHLEKWEHECIVNK